MGLIFLRNRVSAGGGYTPTDSDAAAYITAVETADGQALEDAVREAIDDFVIGCKADGIWTAIKASCILAGARTLNGALTPLVGTAPTDYNFSSGDYNRKTGLIGDGSTKYIDTNRNNNAEPQDSKHVAVYVSSKGGTNVLLVSAGWSSQPGETAIGFASTTAYTCVHDSAWVNRTPLLFANADNSFFGIARSGSASVVSRLDGTDVASSELSQTPFNGNLNIYRSSSGAFYSNARLSFYSIGENLTLSDLDARVSTLMTDLGNAIP